MNNMVSSSSPKRDRVLNSLEQIRASITAGKLDDALRQADGLRELLADWHRSMVDEIAAARAWLDEALQADLLLLNVETANKHLGQWENAVVESDNSELIQYKAQVQERARRKQAQLQTRGVIAHCEELWSKAHELERGQQPAHPDFLLTNYYTRARDVAAAAHTNDQESADLDVLLQKAERLRANKVLASRIYREALEEERYADALNDLTKLAADDLLPRYRAEQPGAAPLTYVGMVSIDEARPELDAQAREWAAKKGRDALRKAEENLNAFQPQAALEALQAREALDRFLTETTRQQFAQLDQRARDEVRMLQHAERRAQEALNMIEEDALNAWEIYVEARTIYEGAPSLEGAHPAIVGALNRQLKQRMAEAEQAFGRKQMELVQQLYQKAQQDYTGKDRSLDELLDRMAEVEWQARTYQEYLQNANTTLEQIKRLMQTDVVTAGELLQQLEGYPDIVLEALPSLTKVRADVTKQMEIETTYSHLYNLLYSDSRAEIEQGIADAGKQTRDPRFQQLARALEVHLAFLGAQEAQAAGEHDRALELVASVAESGGHPDQDAAQKLMHELQSQSPTSE